MNLVRLEPNLWIKSSDAHHKITARLKELFGERVSAIVQGCTDGVPDENGKKENWKQRKEKFKQQKQQRFQERLLA